MPASDVEEVVLGQSLSRIDGGVVEGVRWCEQEAWPRWICILGDVNISRWRTVRRTEMGLSHCCYCGIVAIVFSQSGCLSAGSEATAYKTSPLCSPLLRSLSSLQSPTTRVVLVFFFSPLILHNPLSSLCSLLSLLILHNPLSALCSLLSALCSLLQARNLGKLS
jgi:hypothetical protein